MRLSVSLISLLYLASAADIKTVLLNECCGVSVDNIPRLDRGEALGKLVDTGDDRDLALMGAVRLSVPKQVFLNWYRKVENYKSSPMVGEAVRLHTPPRPADFEKFTIDPNDLKALKSCVPGKCGVKLSAEEIARGQKELDWSAPNVAARAEAMLREILLKHATAYMLRGDEALPKYQDRPQTLDTGQVFLQLLQGSPYIRSVSPELATRLQHYPGMAQHYPGMASPHPDEEMFYCTRERYGFGLKPLLNMTHVIIQQPSPDVAVIVAKQIWASHYYDGSLAVTVLIDAHPGTYLIYINRSRIDLLRRSGFKRALVNRFAPGTTRKEVLALKRTVEQSAEAKATGN